MTTPQELATARAFAEILARQNKRGQAVVIEKESGNVYIVEPGQAKRVENLDVVARFNNDGSEKPLVTTPPLVTFDVTAFRSGEGQFTAVIWRMEDGEAIENAGTVVVAGDHAMAIAEGTKAVNKILAEAGKTVSEVPK
jgi:hypothetical protein